MRSGYLSKMREPMHGRHSGPPRSRCQGSLKTELNNGSSHGMPGGLVIACLPAGREASIPMCVSAAGTSGSRSHGGNRVLPAHLIITDFLQDEAIYAVTHAKSLRRSTMSFVKPQIIC